MSRRDILVEMEAVISLIASEVKDSDAPLPKEDYQHIRAIREYCNQIIEEEIGK